MMINIHKNIDQIRTLTYICIYVHIQKQSTTTSSTSYINIHPGLLFFIVSQ